MLASQREGRQRDREGGAIVAVSDKVKGDCNVQKSRPPPHTIPALGRKNEAKSTARFCKRSGWPENEGKSPGDYWNAGDGGGWDVAIGQRSSTPPVIGLLFAYTVT